MNKMKNYEAPALEVYDDFIDNEIGGNYGWSSYKIITGDYN